MRVRTVLCVLSLALAAPAAFACTGDAAVTTIGPQTLSTGTENGTGDGSSGGTFIQYSGTAPAYVSPVEGTIVTWRVASGSSAAVRLRVLRPAGGGKFTGVGTSATEMTDTSLDTFTTSLPIKAGDVIGVDNETSALLFTTGVLGAFSQEFVPALADGAPAAEPKPAKGGAGGKELELQINADVQPTASGGGNGGAGGGGSGTPITGNGGNGGPAPAQSPTLASLKLSPSTFIAARGGASIGGRHNQGTTVSYADSQTATTTFVVLQKRSGRRNKTKACVAPTRSPHGKPCTQLVTIGSFTHADNSGTDSFHFSGRINGHTLKPGSYELQAVARDAAGLASRAVVSSFRVKL